MAAYLCLPPTMEDTQEADVQETAEASDSAAETDGTQEVSYPLVGVDEIHVTADELCQMELANVTISDTVMIDIPEEIGGLSTFHERYAARLSNAEAYEDFMEVFEYIFPDKEMDRASLWYYGANSYLTYDENDEEIVSFLNLVDDYWDALMSDEEDLFYYYYDEGVNVEVCDGSQCFLEGTSPYGNEFSRFNRGQLAALMGRAFLELPVIPDGTSVTHLPTSDTKKVFARYFMIDKKRKIRYSI